MKYEGSSDCADLNERPTLHICCRIASLYGNPYMNYAFGESRPDH